MKEQKKRSFIKAVTYRASATIATFTLAYAFTGNLEIASQIGLLDFVIKFIIYYINERVWTKTTWGYHAKSGSNQTEQEPIQFSERKPLAGLEH